jgi:tRNA G10  N-methylase Trm11
VYNPFCGRGTVLAAANEIGLDAVGIDNDQRQCDYSEHATLPE